MPRRLFGTSGIRGMDSELSPDFCRKVGYVFGLFLKREGALQKTGSSSQVAMGRDTRVSSSGICRAVSEGLAAAGAAILDQGITPTPALTYLSRTRGLAGAVMVTGSHIDAGMNGMKLIFRGEEVTKEQETGIESLFSSTGPVPESSPDMKEEEESNKLYSQMLEGLCPGLKGMRIAIDCSNGTQAMVMPALLRKKGAELVEINCDPNGGFMARDTETEGAFADLESAARETGLGVGYDPDGDRAIFATNDRALPGDISCTIIAKSIPGDVVTPVSSSSVIEMIGKRVHRTKVGSTHVAAMMKEVGARFGFESNGGGIHAEISYGRDAGATTVKMLRLVRDGRTLSDLVSELPRLYIRRAKLHCPDNRKHGLLEELESSYGNGDRTDGLKIYFRERGGFRPWILFRPSGNEPAFRVFAESDSEEEAARLLEEGMKSARQLLEAPDKSV